MVILGIVGSRVFNNYDLFKSKVDQIVKDHQIKVTKIISGGAKGADSLAKRYAEEHNIPLEEILPDWNKYGRSAGVVRNSEIVNQVDVIIAFWDFESKGTRITIKKALQDNKRIFFVSIKEGKIFAERS